MLRRFEFVEFIWFGSYIILVNFQKNRNLIISAEDFRDWCCDPITTELCLGQWYVKQRLYCDNYSCAVKYADMWFRFFVSQSIWNSETFTRSSSAGK